MQDSSTTHDHILARVPLGAPPRLTIDGADLAGIRHEAESGFALVAVLAKVAELTQGAFAISCDALISRTALTTTAATTVIAALQIFAGSEQAHTLNALLAAQIARSTTPAAAIIPAIVTNTGRLARAVSC